ncbi:MAG: hypothetical protein IPK50_00055 [Fibrobacterota bacterium]|nr:MAG: hypothetical protein IPK50_00055 [Fibrobacterota bacterium]
MILSSRGKLLTALAVQFFLAGAAVIATWKVLGNFGSDFFVRYSSVSAVFLIINYFDFGAIGVARRIGADPMVDRNSRDGQFLGCIAAILRRSIVFSTVAAIVLLAMLVMGISKIGEISYLRSLLAAAAVSPLFICVGALRGYLEGCGMLWQATLVRGGNGLVIAASPLIAALSPWGSDAFFFLPPAAALCLLGWLFLHGKAMGVVLRSVPAAFAGVGRTELTYTVSGVVFLYLDRYVIGWFGRAAEGGHYLFALDMVARSSLLYVPLVLNRFPEMVEISGKSMADGWSFVKANAFSSSTILGAALLSATMLGWFLRSHLPREFSSGSFWWSFGVVSCAYVLQASNFAYQKYLGVNLSEVGGLARIYAGVVCAFVVTVLVVVWKVGVAGLPLAFLSRAAIEFGVLRLAGRHIATGNGAV